MKTYYDHKMIDLGEIKTTTRTRKGKVQTVKLYNREQKQMIINEVVEVTGKTNMTVEEVLSLYNISPPVYYYWLRSNNDFKKEFTSEEIDFLIIGLRKQIDECEKFQHSYDYHIREFYTTKSKALYELWNKLESKK